MICRNPERGQAARDAIREKSGNEEVHLFLADLSKIPLTVQVSKSILAKHPKIDVLVNNAGLYLPTREVSEDGLEMMFAVNHIAAFVLSQGLLPGLRRAEQGRVVTVSSDAHRWGASNLDDLQCNESFRAMRQYGTTKLLNIMFTRHLASRLENSPITANCYHPGAVGTGFGQDAPGLLNVAMKIGKPFLRSAKRGARTGVFLACDESVAKSSGLYFYNEKPRKPSAVARRDDLAIELWQTTADIVSQAGRSTP
jgi:NAD(P)-dependent dehydrogenase (short-subunit alcohol dehydrogenase family)